nr:SpaA isopeptide-forming pilin-related protein [Bifidobacterium sp. CP2]
MKNGHITNKPTEATWNKTDVNGAKLAGSQWKLVGQGTTYCVADDVTVDANGAVSPSGTTFKDCPDGATKTSDHATGTDGTGVITVKELPAGSYTLTETKAPAGYQVSKDTYTLVVKADGTASTITKADGSALAGDAVADESRPVALRVPVRKSVKYTDWPTSGGKYVAFRFAITGASADTKGWPVPEGCDGFADCAIDLAPADDATDTTQVAALFGKLTFTDAQLGDKPGDDGDYAKTYTYLIAETVPDAADRVPDLRYSKAVYRLAVTVSRASDDSGAYAGLKAHAVLTRMKDDDGNAATGDGVVVGDWTVTSTDARTDTSGEAGGAADVTDADAAHAAAFVNTKALTGLPITGTDWTGRLVLIVGGGFVLAAVALALGRRLALNRRRDEAGGSQR